MDGYLAVWKKYADFNGRANRREFWTFVLINIVIGMVLVAATGDAANDQPGLLAMLFYLAALLHDIGKPEAQCRGKREGDPDMHYYGHPEKSMEIVRDIVIPELDRQGYVISCFDVQELLYYVKYHDDHVSVKLKHVRRHTKMASFAMFQNLMLLQLADAKAHIQIPVIAERAEICGRLAGEEGRLLYQRILDGE